MNKLSLLLIPFFFLSCTPKKNAQTTDPEINKIISAIKELPEDYVITIVTEEGDTGERYHYEGEKYEVTDHGIFARIMSPFGMSANEAATNRKGVSLDTHKGTIEAGAGDYSLLERLWILMKNFAVWIVLSIGVLFGLTFVPSIGTVAKGIFTILPILGGLYQKIVKDKQTKDIVNSVQVAKDTLTEKQRQAFNAELEKSQDSTTKKVVKAAKS